MAFAAANANPMAFHRMEPAGPSDMDGQAGGRVSGEQTSQTPYSIRHWTFSAQR